MLISLDFREILAESSVELSEKWLPPGAITLVEIVALSPMIMLPSKPGSLMENPRGAAMKELSAIEVCSTFTSSLPLVGSRLRSL